MLWHAGNHAIANASLASSTRFITHAHLCFPTVQVIRNAGTRARSNHPVSKLQEVDYILQQVPPLPSIALTATQRDINIVNHSIPMLHKALVDRDIATAQKTWSGMTRMRVLGLIGRTTHENYSKILSAMCREQQSHKSWTWTVEERATIGDMASVAATVGYPSGLTAFLLLNIHRKEPEIVLQVYASYVAYLKDTETWPEMKETQQVTPSIIVHSDDCNVEQEALEATHGEEEADFDTLSSDTNGPLVAPEILLCAITAYAMRDDFLGAINTSLETVTRLSRVQITLFSSRLPLYIKANVIRFAYRLETARLAARQSSLFNYLTALTNDLSHKQLKIVYTNLISELTGENPWLTTDPLRVSATTPIVLPDFAWGLFLKGFLYCRQLSMAGQLWDDMSRLGVKPSVSSWTGLLQGYSHLRLGPQLLSAWKLIHEQRVTPIPVMHQALIEGLLRSGMPQEALEHFRQYRNSLHPSILQDPSTLSIFNAAINGLLHIDEEKEAKAILDSMQTDPPHPDIVTYNAFLRYYANRSDFKAIASVLETVDGSKLRGDIFTFSTVLTALLKVRPGDAPQIVFDLMRKQGVKPTIVMYTGIIEHLMSLRTPTALKAGLDVLRTIEQDTSGDVAPNIATYTSILKGILSARWVDAAELEEVRRDIMIRMTRRKLKLNTTTYNVLIQTALENEDAHGAQLAMLYYRQMSKDMVKRDTYFVLLNGLSRRRELALAQEVLSDMKTDGFVPQQSLAKLVSRVQNQIASRQTTYDTNA